MFNRLLDRSLDEKTLIQLAQLQTAFVAALVDRIVGIELLWQTVKQHDENHNESYTELHRSVHSLAGSAGSFGQATLGNFARELEVLLQVSFNDQQSLSFEHIQSIESKLAQLKQHVFQINETN